MKAALWRITLMHSNHSTAYCYCILPQTTNHLTFCVTLMHCNKFCILIVTGELFKAGQKSWSVIFPLRICIQSGIRNTYVTKSMLRIHHYAKVWKGMWKHAQVHKDFQIKIFSTARQDLLLVYRCPRVVQLIVRRAFSSAHFRWH